MSEYYTFATYAGALILRFISMVTMPSGRIHIDTHVHLYGVYPTHRLVELIYNRFTAHVHGGVSRDDDVFCLMLAESGAMDYFSMLRDESWYREYAPQWYPRGTEEEESLWICQDDRVPLLVVAGRQVVTQEKLEVLALGTTRRFGNGKGVHELIDDIRGCGALVVLPWGFGKWWFGRGRLVREIILSSDRGGIALGDSRLRPCVCGDHGIFGPARSRGTIILQGSDPLPLTGDETAIAGYGVVLESKLDVEHPAGHLKRLLMDPSVVRGTFGSRLGFAGSGIHQSRMLFRSIRKKASRQPAVLES